MLRSVLMTLVLVAFSSIASLHPRSTYAFTLDWTSQAGTTGQDSSYGVSPDSLGNVYISGGTAGSLGGPNAGDFDAFISKYDSTGSVVWTQQFGTAGFDIAAGVASDVSGSVYLTGETSGSLSIPDAFVSKYDSMGSVVWTRQFGTANDDWGSGVAADGVGSVYVTGSTKGDLDGINSGDFDGFLRKYDVEGSLLWTRQFGTSNEDASRNISLDGLGHIYVSGSTRGSLGAPHAGDYDGFITKYDAAGSLLWMRQLGTASRDVVRGVSADGLGNVYISGVTSGSLGGANAGGGDVFLSKFDEEGELLWTQQLGTANDESNFGVSADELGYIYISGFTFGSLGGSNAGNADAFVAKYNSSGSLVAIRQFGTAARDAIAGGAIDGMGSLFVSGETQGSLGGLNIGNLDAFVAKFSIGANADFDGNGEVDGSDFLVWQRNFGSQGIDQPGDGNLDGTVDAADYTIWRDNYGTTVGASLGSSTAVPEPTAAGLTALALISALCCRRR